MSILPKITKHTKIESIMSDSKKTIKISEQAHHEARLGAAREKMGIAEYIERAISYLFGSQKHSKDGE